MKRKIYVHGLIVAMVISLIASMPRIIRLDLPDIEQALKNFLSLVLLIWCFWIVTYTIERRLLFPGRIKRLFIYLVSWLLISLFFHTITEWMDGKFFVQLIRSGQENVITPWQKALIIFFRGSVFGALIYGIVRFLLLTEEKQQTRLEMNQLRQDQLEAQLSQLQQQIGPHFLFNSLSTLRTMSADPQIREYILRLSQVYRYLLSNKEKPLVTVGEELELTDSYLYILQQRFEKGLIIHRQIPDEVLSCRIPPFTLQILIENAVKHNVISEDQPLTVELLCGEDDTLIVRNGLHKKRTVEPGNGTGLNNIRHRYALLANRDIRVSEGPFMYEVTVPLIQP